MITEHNIGEWAERYLHNELSKAELARIDAALDTDPELYLRWTQTLEILRTFEEGAQRRDIRNLIAAVADNPAEWSSAGEEAVPPAKMIPLRRYLRITAAAAGLILFSGLSTFFLFNRKDTNKVDHNQYVELVRAVKNIKDSQLKLIDSLNKNSSEQTDMSEAEETAMYGGTGFAISNDGYIATNYHVVRNATSIYVQTRKGDKKAYIVASEPNADIAILKLEDKDFRFGKTALPYNIAQPVSGLGQRVFTIGYPKDDVVYNEGYISCENGYEGDTHSYQLEMTANPGQSGSPVMDKYGSVIALITGKQSNTTGTTYAVHSDALVELVQSLPKSAGIRLSESNRLNRLERTEQVQKMRDYVFSIKVN